MGRHRHLMPAAMPDDHDMRLDTPDGIAEAGERIYAEKYQARLEQEHPGAFVVIDVLSGRAYIASFPEQALQDARADAHAGVFHLIKVGAPGAFSSSHLSRLAPVR
jgi:hypothetical protein